MKRFALGALPFICLLAAWEFAVRNHLYSPYLLPSPADVLNAGRELVQSGELLTHLLTSLWRILIGFSGAALLALPTGFVCAQYRIAENSLSPFLNFIRSAPPIALLPLFILWLGLGELSKIALILLTAFFPMYSNTFSAVRSLDNDLLEVGLVFGLSAQQRFRLITLPSMLPQLLTGVRLGVAYSWRALIGAELLAASSGLGFLIVESEQVGRSDRILFAVFCTAAMGYIMDTLLQRFCTLRGRS